MHGHAQSPNKSVMNLPPARQFISICLACALLVSLVFCTEDTNDAVSVSGVAQRDSAGITIVENNVATFAGIARWRFEAEPFLTIGTEAGAPEYEFGQIGSVEVLSSGLFVVLDGNSQGASRLLFFDSSGAHCATHGRSGRGPGEFVNISQVLHVGGDSIVAFDYPNNRASIVSASGGYIRGAILDRDRLQHDLASSMTLDNFVALGDSVFGASGTNNLGGGASSDVYVISRTSSGAHIVAEFAQIVRERLQLSNGTTIVTQPEQEYRMTVGDPVTGRFCVARTIKAELACGASDGKRTIIRWQFDTVAFTSEHREAEVNKLTGSYQALGRTQGDIDKRLALMQFPDHLNPISGLSIDDAGNFWVHERALDSAGNSFFRYRVLDPSGRLLAIADSLPAVQSSGQVQTDFGSDRVLRSITDSGGVPRILAFRILKGQ